MDTIDIFFETLWAKYTSENPLALKIHESLISEGENIVNDHIALRTFNFEMCGIDKISSYLIKNGYEEIEEYFFIEKKLHAKHYQHKTNKNHPLIFISELEVEKFSDKFIAIAKSLYNSVDWSNVNYDKILYSGLLWQNLNYNKYKILKEESQYAAWFYTNGFSANHFTVSINKLKKYNTTEKLTQFLINNKIKLNKSGGIIKGSEELLLEQLSTMAESKELYFTDGKHRVPTCFYEFAYRYNYKNGNEFRGFLTNSADKIFESTNLVDND
ncbi:MAG: DUF1338 domain-containing protein [Ichthyobacteriaceae bacterium]|nr:DUF1338 domain-containing protein [Ichthyobacteriaceae bacterium]